MNIKIGIDLDNTIIDYDNLFYKIAIKNKLIPKNIGCNRIKIRNFIKKKSISKWKRLQSDIYSLYINEATVKRGFLNFINKVYKKGFEFCIISHKTKYPYIGKKKNLHKISQKWIHNKINAKIDFKIKNIFFEISEKKKINRIIEQKCDYFIDDLPSILEAIPKKTKKILIDSKKNYKKKNEFLVIDRWKNISKIF